MPRLLVIIGSTRPGRAGLPIADWFSDRARTHGHFEVDVADLVAQDLPMFDEPAHPRLGQYMRQHTWLWSRRVDAADAVVMVTPEYNHGYPAALKNAIDYLHREWQHKPVGFVSYGGIAAGTRAVQQLKHVALALQMMPLPSTVSIPRHVELLAADGHFTATAALDEAAEETLSDLARMEAALRPLRRRAVAGA